MHAKDWLNTMMVHGLAADLVRSARTPCPCTWEAVAYCMPRHRSVKPQCTCGVIPRSQGSAVQGNYCKLYGDVETLSMRCINGPDCYAFVYIPKGMHLLATHVCPPSTWRKPYALPQALVK